MLPGSTTLALSCCLGFAPPEDAPASAPDPEAETEPQSEPEPEPAAESGPRETVSVAPTQAEAASEAPAGPSRPTKPKPAAESTPPGEDAPPDHADDDDTAPRTWQAEVFVDVAYGFSSNWPDNKIYRGMFTNPRTGELAVHTVGAFIRHRVNEHEPWWFEFGLHAGAAVDALTSAEPVPGGPDGDYAGSEVFKHIALANAGFRSRKTKTSLGAGVFEGPMGIGSFWTFNNWNYTTTWESNIVPYYLAGAMISQELPGNLTLSAYGVNGFQTYADLNSVPSALVNLTWAQPSRPAPAPRSGNTDLTVSTSVYFGPEGVDLSPKDWLVYSDTYAVWNFDDHFSLAGVWDVAVDRPGRERADQSFYTGGALFARGTVLDRDEVRIDLAVRPEASWDRDGRFFGVDQWLLSGTFTGNLWLWDHLLLRLEYRYDRSTAPDGYFFHDEFTNPADVPLARDQHTVFMALTGWWDFWFGRHKASK
jgi:hypothetical protein